MVDENTTEESEPQHSKAAEASASPDVTVTLDLAGLTDIGKTREINQDQFLIADLHKTMQIQSSSEPFRRRNLEGSTMGKLLVVADGMGGGQAGEVASELAIESLGQYLLNSMHWIFHPTSAEIEKFLDDLRFAARKTHDSVQTAACQNPGYRGMGSTLTVAYLIWPMLYVLHVGDSRCYVLRGDSLQQLTKDQTLAQHLHDCGHLKDEDFEQSPYHHVLLSVIGGNEEYPDAVVMKTRLEAGDRILLCSDGVNAHLNNDEIESVLRSGQFAEEICRSLVNEANRRGGSDNITAVVAISNSVSNTDESNDC